MVAYVVVVECNGVPSLAFLHGSQQLHDGSALLRVVDSEVVKRAKRVFLAGRTPQTGCASHHCQTELRVEGVRAKEHLTWRREGGRDTGILK